MGRMSSVYRVGVKFTAITARNFVADEMNAGSMRFQFVGNPLDRSSFFGPLGAFDLAGTVDCILCS